MGKGRFKVDDIAILARPIKLKHLNGEEVEIIKAEDMYLDHTGEEVYAYTILVFANNDVYIATDNQLEPLDDPNTPSNWSQSLWRPKETIK